jgi:hypothetical protein
VRSDQKTDSRISRTAGWILASLGYWLIALVVTGGAIIGDCDLRDAAACGAAKTHGLEVVLGATAGIYGLAVAVDWLKPWWGLIGLIAVQVLFVLFLFVG